MFKKWYIYTLRLCLRKVCNTFVITKYDKIKTLDELHKFSCKVQFTHESATNNTSPFLDCLIEIDNERRLQTKVYQKKTHAGQYIHYTVNQPKTKTCKSWMMNLVTWKKTTTMQSNDYSEKLITKTIKGAL